MKQGKLIRRAVSAALAGCMMFTLSAPALAESTDALMQLSTVAKSAVSVLDAENGDTVNYGITVTHGKRQYLLPAQTATIFLVTVVTVPSAMIRLPKS